MIHGAEYNSQLWDQESADVARYLLGRGLTHSTIQRFQIGHVREPASGHWRYRDRISIPYIDGMGRERGLRYRALHDDQYPKYLAVSGFNHLFAVRATDHSVVYVTEGEIDAMILWQIGLRAVAVPGAQAWVDAWRYLFRNCDEVVLVFDNDVPKRMPNGELRNPGQLGASKVYRSIASTGVALRSVFLPPGEDVDDIYVRQGEARLKELLAA